MSEMEHLKGTIKKVEKPNKDMTLENPMIDNTRIY